jgi:hypothetical protein
MVMVAEGISIRTVEVVMEMGVGVVETYKCKEEEAMETVVEVTCKCKEEVVTVMGAVETYRYKVEGVTEMEVEVTYNYMEEVVMEMAAVGSCSNTAVEVLVVVEVSCNSKEV